MYKYTSFMHSHLLFVRRFTSLHMALGNYLFEYTLVDWTYIFIYISYTKMQYNITLIYIKSTYIVNVKQLFAHSFPFPPDWRCSIRIRRMRCFHIWCENEINGNLCMHIHFIQFANEQRSRIYSYISAHWTNNNPYDTAYDTASVCACVRVHYSHST